MYRIPAIIALSLLSALMTACGGNAGGSDSAVIISGVAATGAAIDNGSVTLKCADGQQLTQPTALNGGFSFTLGGGVALPCLARVGYADGSGTHTLHSYVSRVGNTDITPLTDLMVAALMHADPETAFADFGMTPAPPFTDGQLQTALAMLRLRLQVTGIILPDTVDPLHDALVAKTATQDGNALDALLDSLQTALSAQNLTLHDLLFTMAYGDPQAPVSAALAQLRDDIVTYQLHGLHNGMLQGGTTPCAIGVYANGDVALAINGTLAMITPQPIADGLVIGPPPQTLFLPSGSFTGFDGSDAQDLQWHYLGEPAQTAGATSSQMTLRRVTDAGGTHIELDASTLTRGVDALTVTESPLPTCVETPAP